MQNIISYFLSVEFEVKCEIRSCEILIGEARLHAEDLCGDMQTCRRVFQTARESTD